MSTTIFDRMIILANRVQIDRASGVLKKENPPFLPA